MVEIKDPPPSKQAAGRAYWAETTSELRTAHPGAWGLTGNWSIGVSTSIRQGKYVAFFPASTPKDAREGYVSQHWEIRTAANGDARNDVYVRWLGPVVGCDCEWCGA